VTVKPVVVFLSVSLHRDSEIPPGGSDGIMDWCGCSLPEAVRLANDRQQWRQITGLSGPHGSWAL